MRSRRKSRARKTRRPEDSKRKKTHHHARPQQHHHNRRTHHTAPTTPPAPTTSAPSKQPRKAADPGAVEGDFFAIKDLLAPDERRALERVRAFLDERVRPNAGRHWVEATTPRELTASIAELGITGSAYHGHGCPGFSNLLAGLIAMEMGRVDASFATFFGVHSGLALGTVMLTGSEEQRRRWVPDMVAWRKIGAFALTEPDVGSAAAGGLTTTARREGDTWVLNGRKKWIGNGTFADLVIVWARDEADGQVKAFVAEAPLSGVRVIDLASVVMGPYAAQILGDLGADVIKIEAPGGDVMRRVDRRDSDSGIGGIALNLNRNKRSAALDLKTPEGHRAALDLIKDADVVITNMRPKALRKLGLTYDDLAAVNPRPIYCNAQGFRSDSQYADLPAYDEVIQATSGMVDLMRRTTGQAHYVPTILADKVCGLTIAYSVLAALVGRGRTGRGAHVEVPMTDTMFAFTLVEHLAGGAYASDAEAGSEQTDSETGSETNSKANSETDSGTGPETETGGTGFARSLSPAHRASRTKDGWACVLPYSHRNFVDFFTHVGHPEVMEDARYATPDALRRNTPDLYEEVARHTERHTTDEWAAICTRLSIPFGRVLNINHIDSHPYWAEGGMLQTLQHPTEGPYRAVGNPIRFSGETLPMRRHCPRIGEHTEELLAEAGWSPERIAAALAR